MRSVRLASVVSESPSAPKFISNTFSSHLLFLPAAGNLYVNSQGVRGYEATAVYVSSSFNKRDMVLRFHPREFLTDTFWFGCASFKSIRLASVVSDLTVTRKSLSNTYRFYLLFLPAAGWCTDVNDRHGKALFYNSVTFGRWLFAADNAFNAPYLASHTHFRGYSVRLASVVSESAFDLQSFSKTYSNHLLFLPAAGCATGATRFAQYNRFWSTSADNLSQAPIFEHTSAGFQVRQMGRVSMNSVRLVSVVSELTSAPKSLSNTHSNHLLFLPAAGYIYFYGESWSQAIGNWLSVWTVSTLDSSKPDQVGATISSFDFGIGNNRRSRVSVRLASVVSELTHAPESCSNTNRFHLLFLPAAGYYYVGTYTFSLESLYKSASADRDASGYYLEFTKENFNSINSWGNCQRMSVRLCSVVSELPHVQKSHSNTYCFHLLFLPAAGQRWGRDFTSSLGLYAPTKLSGSFDYVKGCYFSIVEFVPGNYWRERCTDFAVRLVSVVSGLTFTPKAHSNTCFYHLLFLPEALATENNGTVLDARSKYWCLDAKAGNYGFMWRFTHKAFVLEGWSRFHRYSVRLCSVVSELTVAPKYRSNTHSNHLLFLPAAGRLLYLESVGGTSGAYWSVRSGYSAPLGLEFEPEVYPVVAWTAPWALYSVRLASVVSGLVVAQKSLSNTYCSHLLFLPAGNRREGVSTPYPSAGFYAFISDESVSLWFHGGTFNLKCATYRQWGRHVRLASVVSGLTFTPKSISNTNRFHLLFLPATGRGAGQHGWVDPQAVFVFSTDAAASAPLTLQADPTAVKCTQGAYFGRLQRSSVRLCSVVSGLTFTLKSHSNTCFYHLLFLPAAGLFWVYTSATASEFTSGNYWSSTCYVTAANSKSLFQSQRFNGLNSVRYAVRLVSVVSELASAPKSSSNTFCSHLLFLPAGGFRRGVAFHYQNESPIYCGLNYAHLVCASNLFQCKYPDPAYDGRCVRLCSVVSESAFVQKFFSNISSNHLLFLPVSGRAYWPYSFEDVGSRAFYVSTTSVQSDASYVAPRVVMFAGAAFSASYKSWITRFSRFSIRLVSVVSELAFDLQSLSNTLSNHLLFLPATPYRNARDLAEEPMYWTTSTDGTGKAKYSSFTATRLRNGWAWVSYIGCSVRLASVVSELPFVPKSYSKTCPSHLLFLPAAGRRFDVETKMVGNEGLYASVHLAAEWQPSTLFLSGAAFVACVTWEGSYRGRSVRLVSVVSESAFSLKSFTNTNRLHLLFLPALGFRRGSDMTHVTVSGSDGIYVIFRSANWNHLVYNGTRFAPSREDPVYDGRSVRLASVVSELTHTPKSLSNTYRLHLLFLPAAGYRSGVGFVATGTSGYLYSESSINPVAQSSFTFGREVFASSTGWPQRNTGQTVRLCSVVSELPCNPKSDSITNRPHLLFLPAAGIRSGINFSWTHHCGKYIAWPTRGGNYRVVKLYDSIFNAVVSPWDGSKAACSVRLASVVSELPHVPKFPSTYRSHLLFLPAAGLYYLDSGRHLFSPSAVYSSAVFGRTVYFHPRSFEVEHTCSSACFREVRLVSVVSELTRIQKSHSNTYFNHLLFLPAASIFYITNGRWATSSEARYKAGENTSVLNFDSSRFRWVSHTVQYRESVRLVSVVSELPHAPKSFSNTLSNHLLFLPAADCREGIAFNTPRGGFYQVVDVSPHHIQFGATWINATGGWPQWPAMSVRLCSVVSELPHVPKSFSNTLFNHLLFLSAPGYWVGVFAEQNRTCLYCSSVASSIGTQYTFYAQEKVISVGPNGRALHGPVRLVSVVSVSVFAQKSFSNTSSVHLLFLPAAMRREGSGFIDARLRLWTSSAGSVINASEQMFEVFSGHGVQIGLPVRLASVVSELTVYPKSRSNTFPNHLLFLPAGGYFWLNKSTFAWSEAMCLASSGRLNVISAHDAFGVAEDRPGPARRSVRLCSVVSELAFVQNRMRKKEISKE